MPPERALHTGAELHVDALETLSEVERLAAEWRALFSTCERATAFQSPEWVLGCLRHLMGERPRVLTVREGERLLGIVPFAVGAGSARMWTLAGTGPSDVLDLVARTADAPAVARAACSYLAHRHDWDVLELHELQGDSALAAAARAQLAGHVTADTPLSVCPVVAIPDGAHSLEEIVPERWARRVRRDMRASARAGLQLEIADAANARAHVRDWARLHAACWRARGESGVLAGHDAFIDDVFPALVARAEVDIIALRDASGVIRASCVVLRERARAAYYLGGFDPEIARRSPLVVLVGAVLERAARAGAREVDFLRGAEAHKYRWGAVDRVQHRIRIERRTE